MLHNLTMCQNERSILSFCELHSSPSTSPHTHTCKHITIMILCVCCAWIHNPLRRHICAIYYLWSGMLCVAQQSFAKVAWVGFTAQTFPIESVASGVLSSFWSRDFHRFGESNGLCRQKKIVRGKNASFTEETSIPFNGNRFGFHNKKKTSENIKFLLMNGKRLGNKYRNSADKILKQLVPLKKGRYASEDGKKIRKINQNVFFLFFSLHLRVWAEPSLWLGTQWVCSRNVARADTLYRLNRRRSWNIVIAFWCCMQSMSRQSSTQTKKN